MLEENKQVGLNERQKAFYEFIYNESFINHKKVTQKEICEKFPNDYHYIERQNATDRCAKIWVDVNAINQSAEIDNIIICKKYNYWIGSKEETESYKRSYWFKDVAPRLKRYWNIVKKIKKDGQGHLVENDASDIDVLFCSVFNNYNVELQKESKENEQEQETNN